MLPEDWANAAYHGIIALILHEWKIMNTPHFYGLTAMMLAILTACSAPPTPLPQTPSEPSLSQHDNISASGSTPSFQTPNRHMQSAQQIIDDFVQFNPILQATKQGDDATVADFLARQDHGAMGEEIRNEWLKSLAKRGQSALFAQEYAKIAPEGRQKDNLCYAHLMDVQRQSNDFIRELWENTGKLPEACNAVLLQSAPQNATSSRAWRRVRALISNGHEGEASRLASALGSPLGGSGFGLQEKILASVISPAAQKSPTEAAARLNALSGSLNAEQIGFAWGVLGLAQAKNQEMVSALMYYRQAMRNQLNDEQFEWFARAALRLQQWKELAEVIQSMPAHLQKNPTWQYWLARSHAHAGNRKAAEHLYQQAAQSGRNFYAVLATEELGRRVNTQSNAAKIPAEQVKKLAQDGAIHRALTLFHTSKQYGNTQMRTQAQKEWRYATRTMNEPTLLAAAQLAFEHEFYEMAINSAERTDRLLNYPLRYLTPFRDLVVNYSHQHQVDAAWVYGLIRQESRFMLNAKSSVGAQGLMQVMPATAREIAGKLGMSSSELYSINGNIRMGTWYMADARRRLQNNEVLATAGYNAGPARARRWQAQNALEGAIYAETIPFNETRDYVKKVMTNAVYYAALLNQPNTSLKQRMGVVPAR